MINIFFILNYFLINFLIIYFFKKLSSFFNVYDFPDNIRKFHKKKTSLFGGSIILLNLLLFYLLSVFLYNDLVLNINLKIFISGCLLFYLLGLIDDKKNLNSTLKFLFELLIAFVIVFYDESILIEKLYFSSLNKTLDLGNYSIFFTILCFVIFINALNMSDGINLQSGTYSLIIIFVLFIYSEEYLILSAIVFALLTFLYLNNKSKVFLGDNGTLLIGFILSYLIIHSAKSTNYINLSADKIFILMILPGLELIRLFILRIIKKRHPFSSDRHHIHHILLNNFKYDKVISIIILLSILPILFMFIFSEQLHLIITAFSIFYFIIIKKYEK
jgi:UDP-GlcNAc:undecaprenyl-phosphate GlcNAc-1-phosphate transferase